MNESTFGRYAGSYGFPNRDRGSAPLKVAKNHQKTQKTMKQQRPKKEGLQRAFFIDFWVILGSAGGPKIYKIH